MDIDKEPSMSAYEVEKLLEQENPEIEEEEGEDIDNGENGKD